MRRIRRHLTKAPLPAGKTLATFDFKALPSLPRARVKALAAGDWLDGGGNLIARLCQNRGNSGTGKTHVLCAIHCPAGECRHSPRGGHALVEAGRPVSFTPEPAIWCKSFRSPAAILSSRPPWPSWTGST